VVKVERKHINVKKETFEELFLAKLKYEKYFRQNLSWDEFFKFLLENMNPVVKSVKVEKSEEEKKEVVEGG